MSTKVGAYEAKTRFSELLDHVARGETITVTRHGVEVAQLIPVGQLRQDEARRAVEEIKRMRAGIRLDGLSLTELRDEGRR